MKNYLIAGAVVLAVIAGFAGYEVFNSQILAGAGSAVGTTNATPRVAQTVCNNTATTTYASFLNTDASDRVITNVVMFYTGYSATTSLNLFQVGTSTISSGTSSTAYAVNLTVSTTTDPIYIYASTVSTAASTSMPIGSNANRVWAAGSYLNAVTNATSTGYCTIRVEYLPE